MSGEPEGVREEGRYEVGAGRSTHTYLWSMERQEGENEQGLGGDTKFLSSLWVYIAGAGPSPHSRLILTHQHEAREYLGSQIVRKHLQLLSHTPRGTRPWREHT